LNDYFVLICVGARPRLFATIVERRTTESYWGTRVVGAALANAIRAPSQGRVDFCSVSDLVMGEKVPQLAFDRRDAADQTGVSSSLPPLIANAFKTRLRRQVDRDKAVLSNIHLSACLLQVRCASAAACK
jgi:hypothetical protein